MCEGGWTNNINGALFLGAVTHIEFIFAEGPSHILLFIHSLIQVDLSRYSLLLPSAHFIHTSVNSGNVDVAVNPIRSERGGLEGLFLDLGHL